VINVTINVRNAVRAGRPATGTVAIGGIPRKFNVQQVRQIVVNGGEGDDVIGVNSRGKVGVPIRIDGGAGTDTINGAREATAAQVPTPTPTPTPVPAPAPDPSSALSAFEQQIVDLTNAERLKAGLSPLTVSAKLLSAARLHAGNMAQLNIMSHELPVPGAETPTDRAQRVGYSFAALGENIAYNYADATAVVAAWMNSPGHRANILNADYTEIGVGIGRNSLGEPYYSQEFGRPR
jgi:uncharacterized protein YkwD